MPSPTITRASSFLLISPTPAKESDGDHSGTSAVSTGKAERPSPKTPGRDARARSGGRQVCAAITPLMKSSASGVSILNEYVTPLQRPFVTNELTPRTVLVPPRKFGPPESPKQVPPLPWPGLADSLRNCGEMRSLLAMKLDGAKNRVKTSFTAGLHGPSQGPPPTAKFWAP